ncbi:glycosyltransferase family 39 protein [Piscinibacter sp. HJYY11]|uniref:ArnT family glycosyltransferase n=1 Tax=Piscinibacter sp. HJYY11 TaxID=2801333 RepID=UPI00191E5C1B|nr:glycosyltransferase family 39 protein [Piscinibacter sp. HJYY11]MBL0730323.1 glycosyltransferase family 39 protein [Piscinibacter sp. HJYY11]
MSASSTPIAFPANDGALDARKLVAILGLALLLRIVWALLIPVIPQSDVLAYDTFARTLYHHGVFGWTKDEPFAFWPPGTSIFYAGIYKLFGLHYTGVIVANLAIAVGLIICSARVIARFFGAQAALWAALLLAVWPTLVTLTTLLLSEQLFVLLVVGALDAWTAPRLNVWARAVIAGLLLGMATLVRPFAVLVPGVYAVAMVLSYGWNRERVREQLLLAVVSGVVLLITVSPWTWRNYQLYGHFVLVSTNGGATLWMGNAPGTDGLFMQFPEDVKALNDYERDKVLGALAKQYILDDPLAFVQRSFLKLVRLYNNESCGVLWNMYGITKTFGADAVLWLKRFTQLSWAFIFGLFAIGAAMLAYSRTHRRLLLSPLPLLMLFFSTVHAVVVSGERYHLVTMTSVAALGGIAIATLLKRQRASTPVLATEASR